MIASASPTDGLGTSISASVSGGGNFLRVDGAGKGSPSTGYSDYGSLGEYRIVGSNADSGAAPRVATLTAIPTSGAAPLAVSFDAANSTDSDGSIDAYDWSFGDGSSAAGLTTSHTDMVAGSSTATLTVTDSDGLTPCSRRHDPSLARQRLPTLEALPHPADPPARDTSPRSTANLPCLSMLDSTELFELYLLEALGRQRPPQPTNGFELCNAEGTTLIAGF